MVRRRKRRTGGRGRSHREPGHLLPAPSVGRDREPGHASALGEEGGLIAAHSRSHEVVETCH